MKLKLLIFLICLTTSNYAQNSADVDLVIGTGFIPFSQGQVLAVQSDGKILAGGNLSVSGSGSTAEARLARFNMDGSIDTSFQVQLFMEEGWLIDIKIQSDGKILVAGNFFLINNMPCSALVRLNANGSIDNSFQYIGNTVKSIALQTDGKIVIGGEFSFHINNHLQRNVARLNSDGTYDDTFDFGLEGFPMHYVLLEKVVVQPDGKILAAGSFDSFNGLQERCLMRFNSDGSKDTTFNIGLGAPGGSLLRDIALQPDGKILITGQFISWDGQPKGGFIRLNNDGSLDNSFVLNTEDVGFTNIELQTDGKIVGIAANIINGNFVRVARYNGDGTLDLNFTPDQPNGGIYGLALQTDGKILIGGFLTEIGGVAKNSFARLNSNGTVDTSFNSNTGFNEKVTTITLQPDGKVVMGGDFTLFDGVIQNKIIRFESNGARDVSFGIGSGFNNTVRSIVIQSDGKLLVGGNFTTYNGASTNYLTRLNTDGTKDADFIMGVGFNDYVKTIALQSDGKIVIGGNFTQNNGQVQKYCIRLNSNGTKDESFTAATAFNDRITKIEMQSDGKIIVGGNFSTFNGQNQGHIIRLNPNGTKDDSFQIGTGFNSQSSYDIIRDIKILGNDKIVVAAITPLYNDNFSTTPIRLNADGSVDGSFLGASLNNDGSAVETIAVQQDGKLLLGGSFNGINNLPQSQKRIMRINAEGGFDASFNVGADLPPNSGGFNEGACLAITIQPNGKIWVGGSFFNYKKTASFSAIRLVGDSYLSLDNPQTLRSKTLLFPNPVQNMLYISTIMKSVKITDLSGKEITDFVDTDKIDFSHYERGLYLITLEQENGFRETRKIVK